MMIENTITVIKVDVNKKQISQIEISKGDIQDIYKHLECQCFTAMSLGGGVCCYVDDEGLCKEAYIDEDGNKHNMRGFKLSNGQEIVGNAIVCGVDYQGDSADCPIGIEDVKEHFEIIEWETPMDRPVPHFEIHNF